MSSGVLAPIVIDHLWVSDIQFSILGDPAENMRLNVQEQHRIEAATKDESGSYHLEGSLLVTADLVDEASPERPLVHSHAEIRIWVSVPAAIDKIGEDPQRYLAANAISIAYSHARSSIMVLAGMSPIQSFILPAVLPYSILDEGANGEPDSSEEE
ncbi:hypothetical protein INF26_03880 [Olsenella sp. DSM 107455]|uniref:Preprotein translocase subunit SecB n=1 Tax=Thermophilibacter gallinarum TaxID=2779357 RepID=A0ABR9QSD9_9ACTN|nr:hypothetical protein [Thermophilibacter gallinarum]MBE5023990.1 hypothetical protein [Thermophilibacter gallinarum]